ncbi:MAG TPA: bifunctional hydroxymethylpyrimidine kinase/phosphomethylpyrimidine kinase [Acidobacteriaceae bacterium]|nr:bifunctional hydroxymethylpyrimidine kinase/phosphomethylpyrimidine kinase [Acidobacteriaceae bacterium]
MNCTPERPLGASYYPSGGYLFPPFNPLSAQGCSNAEETERSLASTPDSNSSPSSPPIVLSIAGYDPSAGAGVLADLKTFAAVGVYGMACITALTVQSTQGVRRVVGVDTGIVIETLDCLAEDACFSSIKVGMLAYVTIAQAVADWLGQRQEIPVVLDPIIKSSSGKDLLESDGLDVLRDAWLPRADWITPNLAELAILTETAVPTTGPETEEAAHRLQQMAAQRGNAELKIVVTGGHADAPNDLLLMGNECLWYPGERIHTTSTHGTGCAFSSALAARIALGDEAMTAVKAAKEYVTGALRYSYPLGNGKGPLNHFWQSTFV